MSASGLEFLDHRQGSKQVERPHDGEISQTLEVVRHGVPSDPASGIERPQRSANPREPVEAHPGDHRAKGIHVEQLMSGVADQALCRLTRLGFGTDLLP